MGTARAWRKTTEELISYRLNKAERSQMLYVCEDYNELKALRRRVRAGMVVEPYPHLFERRTFWQNLSPYMRTLHAVRGLQLQHPNWGFCSFSAAAVYGLSVSYQLLGAIHITSQRTARTASKPGIAFHKLGSRRLVREHCICLTDLRQTVLDCLCKATFPQGVAIADSALRIYGIDAGELLDLANECARRHGLVTARRALAFADARAESGGESIARALIHELGFVTPRIQVEIMLPEALGGVRRVDFLWELPDGSLIIGELDGKRKYTSDAEASGRHGIDVVLAERRRESQLTSTGAAIVRFGYRELQDPALLETLLESFGVPRA